MSTYIRGALISGPDDNAAPGYVSAGGAVQVTNYTRKSEWIPDLMPEDHE
ncbi:vagD [Enterobacter kobei]|nr:vagD [Enterobacter kobei]